MYSLLLVLEEMEMHFAPSVPVNLAQIVGPFISVNPLLPSELADHRYKQLDQNRSVINNRVKLEPQYYKTLRDLKWN